MHLSKLAEVYTENGEFALSQLLHNENVVMWGLLNRDSAWASEPVHGGWEVRAAEGAVQDFPKHYEAWRLP